ncbi:MAG: type IVB secretion system protein IcmH/DotU [Ketobacteraceae bacterium]|nr:type IVB secretion system protein IcmH/DotU [Ketobacteraceae bacterium]
MASADDTIVNYRKPKPSPGGRLDHTRGGAGNSVPKTPAEPPVLTSTIPGTGLPPSANPTMAQEGSRRVCENALNPLLAAAQPLIDEIAALNRPREDIRLESYRQELAAGVNQYERQCGQAGLGEDLVLYGRYVLCTVLDEMVNKTPWPEKGEWNRHSLLAQFHGETGGGEKFFDLLDHLLIHPASHLPVLELMFVCLNLGFEGKYHLVPRGHLQLEQVKDNLYQVIRLQRGEAEQSLSPHWQPASGKRQKLMGYIPAWVMVAVTGLLLLAMFSGFRYLIDDQGDRVRQQIEALPAGVDQGLPLSSKDIRSS